MTPWCKEGERYSKHCQCPPFHERSFSVYCPFPGFIEHGKILLIGNMGLYEYRPYVRKIQNSRQIMFQCDRGYSMIEPGPSGATCIAGEWSPPQLPRYGLSSCQWSVLTLCPRCRCVEGSHPSVRLPRAAPDSGGEGSDKETARRRSSPGGGSDEG